MKCFQIISEINIHNDINYLDADCFKVVVQDPDDVVVNNLGNLKNGISLKIIKRSPEINFLKESHAQDFYYDFLKLIRFKKEMKVLYKYYKSKEAPDEEKNVKEGNKSSFAKASNSSFSHPMFIKSIENRSMTNLTKPSSRSSCFKSISGSAPRKIKELELNEEFKSPKLIEENWDIQNSSNQSQSNGKTINTRYYLRSLNRGIPKKMLDDQDKNLSLSDDSMSDIVDNISHLNTHNLPEDLIKDLYMMMKMTIAMIYKLDSAGDNLKSILIR